MIRRMCDFVITATIAGILYIGCLAPADAQNVTCATRPAGDSSNACASTAFVQGAISTPSLTQGYIFVGNASNVASPVNGTNSLVAGGTGGLTTFSNIITGQNYGAAMTNTGEAYGYSFRNSTTTANTIYSAIYPGVSNQDGIQSVINIPATATLGSQGSAISAYFDSNVAASGGGNNAVGLFSTGRCIATGSACFGLNTLLMDASTRTAGSGTGRYLIGAEYDFNVMNTGTQVIGASIGGNSLSQPSSAVGFIVNALGTGIKWDTSFYSLDGVANLALAAGALSASGTNIASQPIWLQYFNGSGVKKKVALQSDTNRLTIQTDDAGMNVTIGTTGTNSGSLSLTGGVSGAVTIQPQAAAGTYNFNLPITSGSSGDLLTSGGGGVTAMTWTTPGALTKTDDTNVTLTLGGSPTTALLHATSLTLGWTGQLSVARGGTGISSGTSGGIPYFSASNTVASSALLTANQIVLGGGAGTPPATLGSLGTTTTVLHGNASGAPTWGAVVSADLNITTTTCTNQFVTAISSGGVGTCTTDTLASAQHANQGTSTTVLHGNAAGNPTWGAVAISTDVSGLGTGVATALGVNVGTAGAFVVNGGALGSPSSAGTMPAFTLGGTVSGGGNQINNVIIGTSTPLAGTFTALTANTSFSMNGSVTYSSANTAMIGWSPTITNNSDGDFLVFVNANFNGSGSSPTGYGSVPQFTPSASIAQVNSGVFGGYLGPGSTITITDAYASTVYWQFLNTAGAVTNAHALYVKPPVIFGSLKPGTSYGVHVANQGISGVTNTYGIYVDAQSGSTNNYALDIEGGLSKVILTTDATHTDRTVCQDTTSSVLYYGSGTAGICLGTSGAQFKTDFSPMVAGLAEVVKLNLQNYRYRNGYGDDGASVQYGLTAQDVEKVLPDLVRHNAQGTAINYDIGALWFIGLRAIQELKADNDDLRYEIEKLKSGR